jgi:hypothetical protein
MITRLGYLLIPAVMMAAGAANAQTLPQSALPVVGGETPRAPIDLSFSRTDLGLAHAQSSALHTAGMVQTSVDQHVGGDSIASFGFLCGRQAVYEHGGIADARGYDPMGKFVGAKLSFAFR